MTSIIGDNRQTNQSNADRKPIIARLSNGTGTLEEFKAMLPCSGIEVSLLGGTDKSTVQRFQAKHFPNLISPKAGYAIAFDLDVCVAFFAHYGTDKNYGGIPNPKAKVMHELVNSEGGNNESKKPNKDKAVTEQTAKQETPTIKAPTPPKQTTKPINSTAPKPPLIPQDDAILSLYNPLNQAVKNDKPIGYWTLADLEREVMNPSRTFTPQELALLDNDNTASNVKHNIPLVTKSLAWGRTKDVIEAHQQSNALFLDSDSGNHSIGEFNNVIANVIPDCKIIAHSSARSTSDNKKHHAIVILAKPISIEAEKAEYARITKEMADHGITLDDAMKKSSQGVFIPVSHPHYEYRIIEGDLLEVTESTPTELLQNTQSKTSIGNVPATGKEINYYQLIAERRVKENPNIWNEVMDACGCEGSNGRWHNPDGTGTAVQLKFIANNTKIHNYGGSDWTIPIRDGLTVMNSNSASLSDLECLIEGISKSKWLDFHRGLLTDVERAQWETKYNNSMNVNDAFAGVVNGGAVTANNEYRPPDLSHDSLSIEAGYQYFYKNARYASTNSKWHFWDGSIWRLDEKAAHFAHMGDYLRAKGDALMGEAYQQKGSIEQDAYRKLLKATKATVTNLKSAQMRSNVLTILKSDPKCAVRLDEFNSNPHLLGTPDGTIDLEGGCVYVPDQSDLISKSTHVRLVDDNPKLWLKFLDTTFSSNMDTIFFMQTLCGYALTGDANEGKLFFFYGTGANGKSVFLEAIFKIMGDYASKAPATLLLEQRNSEHPTAMAGLQGARLVVGSELPSGSVWNDQMIKDLTGGDTVTARYMRGDFFEFKPQFTLIIAGNHQPRLRNVDESIVRRMVMIPFSNTVPKEERDVHLVDKLKAESGAILNWMVQGAERYLTEGLHVPASIQACSDEYIKSEDVIGEFIESCLTKGDSRCLLSVVFNSYKEWLNNQGYDYVMTQRQLKKEFKDRDIKFIRSNNKDYMVGYNLNGTTCF